MELVQIITNDLSYGSREEWLDKAVTSTAKKEILKLNRKQVRK